MGDLDVATHDFMEDNSVFAEFINLAAGEKIVEPEDLRDIDPKLYYSTEEFLREHDIMKGVRTVEDDRNEFILCIENQELNSHIMPYRNLVYDAVVYGRELTELREKYIVHKEVVEDGKKTTKTSKRGLKKGQEFLDGIKSTDLMLPVITVVVYWGEDEWVSPLTLQGDLLIAPTGPNTEARERFIREYTPSYKYLLLDVRRLSEEVISELSPPLGAVVRATKGYGKDKGDFLEELSKDTNFARLSPRAARVIEALLEVDLPVDYSRKEINMQAAIREYFDSQMESYKQAIKDKNKDLEAKDKDLKAKNEDLEAKDKDLKEIMEAVTESVVDSVEGDGLSLEKALDRQHLEGNLRKRIKDEVLKRLNKS